MPKKCKHHEICGLYADVADPEGLCILHSKNPDKDKELFAKKFEEHRENIGDNFDYFVFPAMLDLRKVTFTKEANFGAATFTRGAVFNGATFNEGAIFDGARFIGIAIFKQVTFTKEAAFTGAIFTKEADFGRATFKEGANFGGATFTKRADFDGTEFTKEANFGAATFTEWANFGVATFTKEAAFDGAIFSKGADFVRATFTEGANLGGATFTEEVHFGGAEFVKRASFFSATFTEWADFTGATFTELADFSGTKFMRGARFWGTIFEADYVIFSHSSFLGRTLFIGRKDEKEKTSNFIFSNISVFFNNVDINPTDKIIFRDADLSQCLFQGTRVNKVEFTSVKWAMIPGKLGYSRTGIYDEKILLISIRSKKENKKKDKDDLDWEHIERVYRDLKINHKESGDHERAGDFHYGEKEMRRRNPGTPLMHRFFLNLYRILSGYGERYLRPLGWVFGLLIVSTIGYMILGIAPKDGAPFGIANTECWFKAGLYSLQVMTLQRPTELQPIGVWATAIKTFQSIVGPVLIGLFALALRQRLKR